MSGLDNNFDFEAKNLAAAQRSYSEMLLETLKKRRRSAAERWVAELAQDSISEQAPETSNDTASGVAGSLFIWLERLFDEFDHIATEFNGSASGTDLIVSCSRASNPALMQNDLNFDDYQARVSTRFWSLIFAVKMSTVSIFMIPSDILLAFTTGEYMDYQPFLVLDAVCNENGKFQIQMNDTVINRHRTAELARELFRDLILVASGKLNEDELGEGRIESVDSLEREPRHEVEMYPSLSESSEAPQTSFAPPESPSTVINNRPRSQFAPGGMTPVLSSALEPSASLTDQFWQEADAIRERIDGELNRLAIEAGKSAQMSDLGTMARCKRLAIALSSLRDELTAHMVHLQQISEDNLDMSIEWREAS